MQKIYKIKNTVNGKYYIGRTGDLNSRVYHHFNNLENGTHHNIHMQRSWNKHGKSVWEVEVYCKVDTGDKDADIRYSQIIEQSFLDKYIKSNEIYNTSYSSVNGVVKGEKHHFFGKHPADWMGAGYLKSKETLRGKIGAKNHFYGRKHTEETKAILRVKCAMYGEDNGFYGRKHTAESIEKMKRSRSFQFVPVEVEGVAYESIAEASRKTKYSPDQIRLRLDRESYTDFKRI